VLLSYLLPFGRRVVKQVGRWILFSVDRHAGSGSRRGMRRPADPGRCPAWSTSPASTSTSGMPRRGGPIYVPVETNAGWNERHASPPSRTDAGVLVASWSAQGASWPALQTASGTTPPCADRPRGSPPNMPRWRQSALPATPAAPPRTWLESGQTAPGATPNRACAARPASTCSEYTRSGPATTTTSPPPRQGGTRPAKTLSAIRGGVPDTRRACDGRPPAGRRDRSPRRTRRSRCATPGTHQYPNAHHARRR
jgi:hypothetical protein